jgi:hypothetical protein
VRSLATQSERAADKKQAGVKPIQPTTRPWAGQVDGAAAERLVADHPETEQDCRRSKEAHRKAWSCGWIKSLIDRNRECNDRCPALCPHAVVRS